MMIDILNTKGEKTGTMKLPSNIFGVEAKPQLIAQVIRVYLANQRTARPRIKTRGEVRGSRRKIWRQKGTGRARHSDRYAPIFVGGGVAHGPKGIVKRLKIPKKMKKRALFGVLSQKVREKKFLIVEGLSRFEAKTKKMAALIGKMSGFLAEAGNNQKAKPKTKGKKGRVEKKKAKRFKAKALLVLKTDQKNAFRSAGNLEQTEVAYFNQLNSYQVLNNDLVIFSKEAVEEFTRLHKPV